jgi:hypothetical protein
MNPEAAIGLLGHELEATADTEPARGREGMVPPPSRTRVPARPREGETGVEHSAAHAPAPAGGLDQQRPQPGRGLVVGVPTIATIGVYGATLERFLHALADANVRNVLDVRQRRGVRGREYAWANSQRLQRALAEAGFGYRHLPELAPTTELRHLQYAADDAAGVGKRSRRELAPEYAERYRREILDCADLGVLLDSLPEDGIGALMCVERDPDACHRSIIARRLADEDGFAVLDLRP